MQVPDSGSTDAHPVVRPHAPLSDYYGNEDERHLFLRRIFDDTARDYERVEHILALGTGSWYRRQALQRAGLQRGMQVLDVGIGTGLVAREALRIVGKEGSVIGIDPSPGMLGQVRLPGVELVQGRAEALPRPPASCDFLSMGYALRHIGDVSAAFAEFRRVMRPGARLLVLEITRPAGRLATSLLKAYMRSVVPLIARTVGQRRETWRLWRYHWDTIEACIPSHEVIAALRAAGFADVKRHLEVGIFSEYTAIKATNA